MNRVADTNQNQNQNHSNEKRSVSTGFAHGEGLSASYPPQRKILRTRKQLHPMSTSAMNTYYSTHYGGRGHAHGSLKSASGKSQSEPILLDQVVPLDFSVRRKSNKRPSVIAFGVNEIDTSGRGGGGHQHQGLQGGGGGEGEDEQGGSASKRRAAGPTVIDASTSSISTTLSTIQKSTRQQLKDYFANSQNYNHHNGSAAAAYQVEPINFKRQRQDDCDYSNRGGGERSSAYGSYAKKRPAVPSVGSSRGKNATASTSASGTTSSHYCAVNGCACSSGPRVAPQQAPPRQQPQVIINYQFFIDEHFRRSLGNKKYRELFSSSPTPTASTTTTSETKADEGEEEEDEEPELVDLASEDDNSQDKKENGAKRQKL